MESYSKVVDNKKKIICFGAGSYFQIMYYDLKSRKRNFKVIGVIDNNLDKIGKELEIMSERIPILSIQDVIKSFKQDEIMILITTCFQKEVIEQLRKNDFFKEVEIISYNELKIQDTNDYFKIDVSLPNAIIPKRIHYCWFGGKEMPAHLQREVENWHKLCPDYEFICWNETNYDVNKIIYTKEAYSSKRWAHLPDYVRLDVVYNYGGIYLDTDVELLKSPDALRNNTAFFCTEVNGGINEGSGFGAIEKHPFIKKLMNVYEKISMDNPLYRTTSLGKEIKTFYEAGYINNGEFQMIDDVAIYPYQVLSPIIKETEECKKTQATIGIHHFEGSWCQR